MKRIECDRCGHPKPCDAFYVRDGVRDAVCITCRLRARRSARGVQHRGAGKWCIACAGMPHRVEPPIAGARCEACGIAYSEQPTPRVTDFLRRKDSAQVLD